MKLWSNTLTRPGHARPWQVRGVTMLELMVTLGIVSMLIALALPSFENARRNSLIANSTNDWSASLARARAEAIKARRNVRMCPTTNNTSCGGTDWAGGWIMFVDRDGNNTPATSELIAVGDALDWRVSLTAPTAFSSFVQFRPSGAVTGNAGSAGNFNVCSGDFHDYSRVVGIAASGRVTAHKQADVCNESS